MPNLNDRLSFSGRQHFAAPPERVFQVLTDIDAMAARLPSLVSKERLDDRTIRCVIRFGVAFIRPTTTLTMRVVEAVSPRHAKTRFHIEAMGTQVTVDSQFEITATGAGTSCDLAWTAEVLESTGLAAKAAAAVAPAFVKQVIDEGWTRVHDDIKRLPR